MYYKGEDYDLVDKMALRLRIDYNHLGNKVDVFKLAEQLNMKLIKYSSLTTEQLELISQYKEFKDGFTIFRLQNGEYEFYTFYNDSMGDARIRFTIAHEIKHVVFLEENPTQKQEDLANYFARYLLVPTCLIKLNYNTFDSVMDIVNDFDVSFEAASNAYYTAFNRKVSNKKQVIEYEEEFITCVKNKCK